MKTFIKSSTQWLAAVKKDSHISGFITKAIEHETENNIMPLHTSMVLSHWVLCEALVEHKTLKMEKVCKRAMRMIKCMKQFPYEEKTWLKGDILVFYVLLNSLEEVNKNQLFISCTRSCTGRESEASASQVQNKPRLLVLSKAFVQTSFKLM